MDVDSPEQTLTLELTDSAAREVEKFMQTEDAAVETAGLRVSVLPGGCSGFQYGLNIEAKALDDDLILESQGIRLFVDAFSAQYLDGVRIGFKSTITEAGFTFDNPGATGGCGCGSSFSA